MTPTYDWINDPKGYKTKAGAIPHNRCFHCGLRFIGSEYAAFCNICDNEMTPDSDDSNIFVVTNKEKKEGYTISRREYVSNRIRIPDDSNEEQYKKKLEGLEKEEKPKATFTRADELVDMMQ